MCQKVTKKVSFEELFFKYSNFRAKKIFTRYLLSQISHHATSCAVNYCFLLWRWVRHFWVTFKHCPFQFSKMKMCSSSTSGSTGTSFVHCVFHLICIVFAVRNDSSSTENKKKKKTWLFNSDDNNTWGWMQQEQKMLQCLPKLLHCLFQRKWAKMTHDAFLSDELVHRQVHPF